MNPLAPYFLIAKWVAIVGVFVGALGVFIHLKHKYDDSVRAPVEQALKLSDDSLKACRANNAELAAGVEHQNSAIESLQANAEKRIKDSDQAAAEARKLTTKQNERVNAMIASAPLSPNLCESARLRMVPQ